MENKNYNQSLPPLEPGTLLNGGRFEIKELTNNRGGFGRIYRAIWHLPRENEWRVVAIKEFHILEHEDAEWSKMYSWTRCDTEKSIDILDAKFREEAKSLSVLRSNLKDEHIPKIIGRTWEENGRLFYAMYYIDGLTLTEMVIANGCMPENKAVGYIIQVAKVLHKAHEKGLCHADVSPNNIMLQNKDKSYAVLVDWGNANSYDDELLKKSISADYQEMFLQFQDDVDKVTERISRKYDGAVGLDSVEVGTRGYTAPQSFWGKTQRDVYSLAATLFFLLTGVVPQVLDTGSKIAEARELLVKNGVSNETTEAIIHAMNVNVKEATQSMIEFMMELPKETVIKMLLNYTDHDK